ARSRALPASDAVVGSAVDAAEGSPLLGAGAGFSAWGSADGRARPVEEGVDLLAILPGPLAHRPSGS
ncbi:MAG: hypothetical protein ACLFV7_14030, partial [Phycisphaerae bacterium]